MTDFTTKLLPYYTVCQKYMEHVGLSIAFAQGKVSQCNEHPS